MLFWSENSCFFTLIIRDLSILMLKVMLLNEISSHYRFMLSWHIFCNDRMIPLLLLAYALRSICHLFNVILNIWFASDSQFKFIEIWSNMMSFEFDFIYWTLSVFINSFLSTFRSLFRKVYVLSWFWSRIWSIIWNLLKIVVGWADRFWINCLKLCSC